MREAIQHLERVRRVGRRLLFAQHAAQWLGVVLAAVLLCGLIDYALRLPGWLRLVVGVSAAGSAAVWLVNRLAEVVRFQPSLSLIALRAERLYPQLQGVLASGVELATQARDKQEGAVGQGLTHAAIDAAQRQVDGVQLERLVKPQRTAVRLLAVGVVVLLFCGVLVAAPASSRLAAKRWLLPLGDTRWPNRTKVQSLVDQGVWPVDTPLRLRARVERGYSVGMRAWVVYRWAGHTAGQPAPWQSLLMSEQHEPDSDASAITSLNGDQSNRLGVFERLIDLADPVTDSASQEPPAIEFYFLAGDDSTSTQSLRLVRRPSVDAVSVKIDPPPYAADLVAPRQVRLDRQPGQAATVSALVGSAVQWHTAFNKPIAAQSVQSGGFMPGLIAYPPAQPKRTHQQGQTLTAQAAVQSFVLDQTVQTPIHIADTYGLSNLSERVYRIEAVPDHAPSVAMIQPSSDQSVLPTALIEIEAVAQDDVGIESLWLEAKTNRAQSGGDTEPAAGDEGDDTRRVAQVAARQTKAPIRHSLDLRSLALEPGDELLLTAVTQDVYDLNGERHAPTRSTPRRLRIIDTVTLIAQIRSDLAAVRQQAIRLEAKQRALLDEPVGAALPHQRQLTEGIDAQSDLIDALKDRAQRNRLDPQEAGQLHQLLERGGVIFDQAGQASGQAQQQLQQAQQQPQQADRHRQAASRRQQEVQDALAEAISLLDQGRDALTLQLQLQQLQAMQEALAGETREMMPQTLGWTIDQLSKPERQQLEALAGRQEGLAKLSQSLIQQMQTTSEALSRHSGSPDDEATAQVLAEAASIAQRQGLARTLDEAAQNAEANRLSEAGGDQQAAMDTMRKMLQELADVQDRRQAILRRRLVKLAEAIRRLVEQQQQQLDRLGEAVELAGLDAPLSALRRTTLAVADRARGTPASQQPADLLDKAAMHQADAITALRLPKREPAVEAQQAALEALQEALALVEQMRKQAQDDKTDKEREALRQEYIKLAQEQDAIHEKTSPLAQFDKPGRMERALLIKLGHRQADLKIAADAMRDRVEQTLVFNYLHDQIDERSGSIASQLRKAKADQAVLDQQETVASLLRHMAEALQRDPQEPEFAGAQGGGGGGGGGGGQPPPLVPPVAELKLLRGVQEVVYHRTRQIEKSKAALDQPQDAQQPDTAHSEQRYTQMLLRLAQQQTHLAQLGQRLIEQVRQSAQQPEAQQQR